MRPSRRVGPSVGPRRSRRLRVRTCGLPYPAPWARLVARRMSPRLSFVLVVVGEGARVRCLSEAYGAPARAGPRGGKLTLARHPAVRAGRARVPAHKRQEGRIDAQIVPTRRDVPRHDDFHLVAGQRRLCAHARELGVLEEPLKGPRQRMIGVVSRKQHQACLPMPFVCAEAPNGILLLLTNHAPAAVPTPKSVSAVATGCIWASRNRLDVSRPPGSEDRSAPSSRAA